MNPQLQQLEKRFNDMTARERGMVLAAGLVVITMLLFSLWLGPTLEQSDRLTKQLQQTEQSSENLQQQIDTLHTVLKRDPNDAVRVELKSIEHQIAALDTELGELTVDLVSAEQMLPVLQSLLSTARNVTLVGLSSIPAQPVLKLEQEQQADVGMYRHGIELQVTGSFFDVYRLIESIESSQWRFYWQLMDYQVTEYPEAEVRILLYTLSTSEDYIRV
ncbi:type II secretion system protein M [Neiella sp. HB171785]|uniref:Type II secretion system protein M n=1 Tax=Neiella litorisoli TaxID=2771431 RepID=A0A8J6UQE5_9GAMM|nr:type II secretion system protein GspM [Neiella litorisoli]MBD1391082.1 type II secretion system protein M [Neiella litorisoli]